MSAILCYGLSDKIYITKPITYQEIDGNIVKYAVRKKDGESDMERYKKIKHYAELAMELKCGSN